jgi:glycosyltransferase involved in cell wall biosynthesis
VFLLAYVHPDAFNKKDDLAESKRVLGGFCREIHYFPLWPKLSQFHKLTAYMAAMVYPRPFSVLAHKSAAIEERLQKVVALNKPDLIHIDTIALAPLLHICSNTAAVMTHQNIESRLMYRRARFERSFLSRWFVTRQARLLAAYEKHQSLKVDLNVMVSTQDARALEEMVPGARTLVVENGVDTQYFRPRPGEEGPAVIYTGGMNMFANRDAVIWFLREIWPLLKKRKPGLRFFAVGQSPSKEIRELAAADDSIELPGFVDDIRPWVARAAVYIVPLRVGGGTRLKIVDAMAQGKAIVSTSLGCEGIRVTDGNNILIADEPDAFACKVAMLLDDSALRQMLGQAARRLAEQKYSWPHLGEKLISGYQRILNERGLNNNG